VKARIGLCIISLFLVVVPCQYSRAVNLEFHPGLYTSYEYTDNYTGVARDAVSESIFEVGPSLALILSSQALRWDLTGYLARSVHREFEDDDSTEVRIETSATIAGQIQSMTLGYAYSQSRRRESLGDPSGIRRIHAGSVAYAREMTQRTSLRLSTDASRERTDGTEEEIDSWGGQAGLSWRASQRTTIDVTSRYVAYTYELREDTSTSTNSAHVSYAVNPRTSIGVFGDYVHVDRGDDPDEDIYSTSATMRYTPYEHISLSLRGGYSWLSLEDEDRQETYTVGTDIARTTDRDTVRLSFSRGYRADFTVDRYGTYDIREARLAWDRRLTRTLSTSAAVSYEESRPTFEDQENEEDLVAGLSLLWGPLEYLDARLSYNHLRHTYEISDTVSENRYRVIVEVRY